MVIVKKKKKKELKELLNERTSIITKDWKERNNWKISFAINSPAAGLRECLRGLASPSFRAPKPPNGGRGKPGWWPSMEKALGICARWGNVTEAGPNTAESENKYKKKIKVEIIKK